MELIKIQTQKISDQEVNAVSAKELHKLLGVGRDFSTWIKNRLETLGSIENEDYILVSLIPQNGGSRGGDRRSKDYFITLDTAKHIAMMEKNEVGKQVRNYFIQCEKKLKEISTKDTLFLNIIKAEGELETTLAIKALDTEYIKPLEEANQRMAPKEVFYDSVVQSESMLDIGQVSKLLSYKGLGRNNLFKYLRDKGILNHKNVPYQQYIDQGYFKLTETSWVNPKTQALEVSIKPVLYQKGIDWLDKKLSSEGYRRSS